MRAYAITLMLLVPLTVTTQAPADFSGNWTLEPPKITTTAAVPGTPAAAAAPGDMGSGWGSQLTITQDARRLSVEYSPYSRYDAQPPLTFHYPLDGSEGRNIVSFGRGEQVETSKARWNGASLVITTTYHVTDRNVGKPFTAEVTRTLTLESPTSMIVEVARAGVFGGAATATRSVYKKS